SVLRPRLLLFLLRPRDRARERELEVGDRLVEVARGVRRERLAKHRPERPQRLDREAGLARLALREPRGCDLDERRHGSEQEVGGAKLPEEFLGRDRLRPMLLLSHRPAPRPTPARRRSAPSPHRPRGGRSGAALRSPSGWTGTARYRAPRRRAAPT